MIAFFDLHHGPRPLLLPNAWDVGSARALVEAGFPAIGTTSLGVAAAHGLPDAARVSAGPVRELARELAGLPCPVSIDLEDGYADEPGPVAELVASLGVAGVNLEDSTGERLVDPAVHAAKIAAVKSEVSDVFLNARVDTYWLNQDATPASTLARARVYVSAGADGIFVPGALGAAEIDTIVDALAVPVNVLASTTLSIDRLADLGVARISCGSLLYRAALDQAVAVAVAIRDGALAPSARSYAEVNPRPDLPAHLRRH